MKAELTKQYVKKMIKKIVIFAFFMVIVSAIGQAVSPTVSNELALTQMQNSNEMYVLMNTYNKIKPLFTLAYSGITLAFGYSLGKDTYKFVKATNTEPIENKKEN